MPSRLSTTWMSSNLADSPIRSHKPARPSFKLSVPSLASLLRFQVDALHAVLARLRLTPPAA